ncbi:MAG: GIY-YIG nuclease family protein [Vicingaceae bacterium]|nr:GIY-YIG nuclease family protein [Vicingaceae bacterium]
MLYSKVLDNYYIGQTNDVGKRLERHNKGYEKFTSRGIPWDLKGFKEFSSRKEAMKEEKRIKNFKSRKKSTYKYLVICRLCVSVVEKST